MTSKEINQFINLMNENGDKWSPEDVERAYGESSLNDAIQDRVNDLNWFSGIIDKVMNNPQQKGLPDVINE